MGSENEVMPYKKAYVYNGENDQFINLTYWSKKDKKYVRKKLRLVLGFRLNKERKEYALNFACNELNKIIAVRNRQGLFHEDFISTDGIPLFNFYDWIKKFSEVAGNDLAESTRKTIGNLYYSYGLFLKANPVFGKNTPSQISDTVLREYVKHLQEQDKVGKTINSYLWAIKMVSEKLVEKKVLEEPIDTEKYRVKQVKNESGRYRPLTEEEKTKIFGYFRNTDQGYYLYLLCIYYTCIRPSELKRLLVENFDFSGGKIYVPWYTSKNGLTKYVQILSALNGALLDSGIDKLNKKWYLFSNLHKPGAEQYTGKWSSDKWRAACNKLGIDETANMYGLKHTFNVDYVERNKKDIDWEWLRRHNRHATIQQTQEYISGLTAYFLDETKATIKDYHIAENTQSNAA
jgi:integrase